MPLRAAQSRAAALLPLAALWVSTTCIPASSQAAPATQPATRSPDTAVNETVHLQGESLALPLVVIKGFPFLEGEINGTRGKLLFDIGEEASLALNSHLVTPPNGKVIGNGFFGSGQTFSVLRFPVVDSLKLLGGPEYTAIQNVRGNPGLPLEQHITPDFIGWIGLSWFQGYLLKLDYARPSVSFFRDQSPGESEAMPAALKGEKVLQVLHFSNAGHPNLPTLPVHIGTHTFLATFDTGSHNVLWLTPELREQLKADGSLHQEEDDSFQLASVSIDGRLIDLNSHVEISQGSPSFAKSLRNPTDPVMTLGYEFLSHFRTVWDYEHQTVTLLEK